MRKRIGLLGLIRFHYPGNPSEKSVFAGLPDFPMPCLMTILIVSPLEISFCPLNNQLSRKAISQTGFRNQENAFPISFPSLAESILSY